MGRVWTKRKYSERETEMFLLYCVWYGMVGRFVVFVLKMRGDRQHK